MAKFRKRPIVVEAWQYPGPVSTHPEWLTEDKFYISYKEPSNLYIRTLEGDMKASPGDWIIKGVKGELYPCKPDIFEATYEPVPYANTNFNVSNSTPIVKE